MQVCLCGCNPVTGHKPVTVVQGCLRFRSDYIEHYCVMKGMIVIPLLSEDQQIMSRIKGAWP